MEKEEIQKMRKEYLLIKCGYEGIDGLLFLTDDPELAKSKIVEFRQKVVDAKMKVINAAKANGITTDGIEFRDVKYMLEEKIGMEQSCEFYSDELYDEEDQYCINVWNGEEFKCCCKELGVEPKKMWLY